MSVFQKAKVVESNIKLPKKKNEPAKVHVPGLENLAVIDALIKGLTTLRSGFDMKVKESMKATFIKNGKKVKARPANFKGFEGELSTASCELKNRSSSVPLNPDEIKTLEKYGIPFKEVEYKADCYIINPAYTNDSELLEKVAKVLENTDLPEDFIMKQEKQVKTVVVPETIDAIFEKGVAPKLFDMVCSLSVKPTYIGTIDDALPKSIDLVKLMDEDE